MIPLQYYSEYKRIIYCMFIVVGTFLCLQARTRKKTDISDKKEWKLVWKDDFTSSKLDTNVWSLMERWNDGSRRYLTSNTNCFEIKNSKLLLKGILNSDSSDTAKYLTAGITTKNKKSFGPGRIEIKAKFKSAQGAWPALWLLPFNNNEKWPDGGEIDIMEHLNFQDLVYQTVHSAYTKRNFNALPNRFAKTSIKANQYNIYSVDLLSDSIIFYVNGERTLSYPRVDSLSNEGQFPFNKGWYLMMNMQLGGNWAGPVNNNDLPSIMEIDWVKYYQKLN